MKDTKVDYFKSFIEEIETLLESTANNKGYNETGVNGENELYTFVSSMCKGPSHPAGEIVYKIKRYMARKDKKDLVKIAAWAYLIWRFDD